MGARRRWLGICVLILLLTAACGRDSTTDTTSSSSSDPGSGTGSSSASSDIESAAAAGLDRGEFGDLGELCSEGDPAPVTDETPGLTETEVHVATFADPGFQGRPGLNQEFFDTAEAVTKWCNEHGGINGRTIVLDKRDAKLTEYQQRMIESCDEDFIMVGGGGVFDDAGQPTRLECGLPDISGFMVTGVAAGSQLHVEPVPNPINSINVGELRYFKTEFPDAVDHLGIMTGDLQTVQVVAQRLKEAAEGLGYTVVHEVTYSVGGEDNWKPFVQALKDKGVRGVLWVGEPENLAEVTQAMRDIDYEVDFIRTDANHYDNKLIEIGGDALGNVFTKTTAFPFERAGDNLATTQYLQLIDEYTDGGKVALLGAQGLSSWLLFLQAANACDEAGTFTRDCVYDEARVDSWSGGGLHAEQKPGQQVASECLLLLQAGADGFTEVDLGGEDDPFSCSPDNVVTLKGDYGKGAECPSGEDDPKPSTCAG